MSNFLWVEDFAFGEQTRDIKNTAEKLLGGIYPADTFLDDERDLKVSLKKHGTFLELSYQDALGFISSQLNDIDYVILDIDLPAYGENDSVNESVLSVLKIFEGYVPSDDPTEDESQLKEACNKLKKNAGFYLYAKLVFELGFPKQHIQFFSNHGKEVKSIEDAFKMAKIASPEIYLKSDNGIRQCVESFFDSPYSRLRRGIIEGCKLAKTLSPESLYFNKYIPNQDEIKHDEIISYFEILENFLPLREPENKQAIYKLFVRTLSHEWEAAKTIRHDKDKPDAVLAWIMRNTRHWITHNSSLFDALDERFLAFLFIVNLRVMFKFDDYQQHAYEGVLLKLFENESLTQQDFSNKTPPVSDAYLALRNHVWDENNKIYEKNKKSGSKDKAIEEAFYFNDMANNVQLSNSPLRHDKEFFIKLLYQTFWLITCNPYVDKRNRQSLEIKFGNFKYSDKPYMLELARSIYHRSFPET